MDERLAPQIHTGGLSTREGLALMIHDGWTQGKEKVPPIEDKRLLAVESEFANILHQALRNGNTLSAALRDAWDGTSIRPATKTCRVWASNPHIGLLADITPSELRDLMTSREFTNGFANRFIFFWAEGDQVNPFPKPTPKHVIDGFARRISDVLLFAGADRHLEQDFRRIEFSAEAASVYATLYRGELRDYSAGERITALLDRRATMLMRLAMIFALTEKTLVIDVRHINAAMAWIRYWTDSVKFIFQSAADELAVADVNNTATELMGFLKLHGKASRTEILKGCFQGHINKSKLDKAIDELISASPPLIEVETIKGEGRPSKFYKRCANYANNEEPCGLQPDSGVLQTMRTMRTNSTYVAKLANFAEHQNTPQTRIDSDTSLISHSSQVQFENPEADLEDSKNLLMSVIPIQTTLDQLRSAGLTLGMTTEGGLQVKPASSITPELRNLIRQNRAALVDQGQVVSRPFARHRVLAGIREDHPNHPLLQGVRV